MKLWAVTTTGNLHRVKLLGLHDTVEQAAAHRDELGKGHTLHIFENGALRWLNGDEQGAYNRTIVEAL